VVDAESSGIVDEATGIASPQRVAAGEGSIWVTSSSGGGSVIRLDRKSHDVIDTIPVGSGPIGIAVGAGAVWVANASGGTVSRIDPATGRDVSKIPVGNTPTAVAVGNGAVWVTNADDRTVLRIDPASGRVGRPIDVGAAGPGIAVGGGGVWVTDPVGNALVRVDARSSLVTDRIPVGSGPTAVAYGDRTVWVTNSLDGSVSRIDAEQAIETARIPIGSAPNGITAASGGAWVTDEVGGTLVHVDHGRPVLVKALGGRPEGVTLIDGSLWIAVQAAGGAHRGGTLRMVGPPALDSIDPARGYGSWAWDFISVTHDGLVGYKRVGGAEGNTLVPDLARALPTPGDGMTYTFRLRPGIKFSNGEELKASAVRSSFERGFRTTASAGFRFYYGAIVGAASCRKRPNPCDLSRGIVIDDDAGTVTIRLRAPDPEFLYKLALPFASIVPVGTPVSGNKPVPGTGPYRFSQYEPKRRIRLVRNRHFRVWSKAAQPQGFPDEIVLNMADTPDAHVTAVERGHADRTLEPPTGDRLEEARTRYAGQLHVTPSASTEAVMLNTSRPPFDDVRARRAVAYAFDRQRLDEAYGSFNGATCQLLPPNFPAYRRYCPYITGERQDGRGEPDIGLARKLVAESGTQGMQVDVLGTTEKGGFGLETTILAETLQQLGYRTSLRRVRGDFFHYNDVYRNPASVRRVEAATMGWIGDYPAASNFMTGLLECPSNPYACNADLDRKLRETLQLQTRNPQASNEAWARLEREVVDQAIIVPIATGIVIDFVSKRLGNYQRNPFLGMLISQVWVR
jgi:YVTN family beta-propeller protein